MNQMKNQKTKDSIFYKEFKELLSSNDDFVFWEGKYKDGE